MRALHAYARSDPSRLVLEDAPLPTLAPGDVLVRVHASGVTPSELDWNLTWLEHDDTPGTPPIIPGHEVAGVVEALGPDVTGLAAGDEVYGLIMAYWDGAAAEKRVLFTLRMHGPAVRIWRSSRQDNYSWWIAGQPVTA